MTLNDLYLEALTYLAASGGVIATLAGALKWVAPRVEAWAERRRRMRQEALTAMRTDYESRLAELRLERDLARAEADAHEAARIRLLETRLDEIRAAHLAGQREAYRRLGSRR